MIRARYRPSLLPSPATPARAGDVGVEPGAETVTFLADAGAPCVHSAAGVRIRCRMTCRGSRLL